VTIITVSRGSYSKGKEIAEKVSERLGYRCLSREDLIREVSRRYQVPEVKLKRAIHDAPTLLDRIGYRKEIYIAYIEATLLKHFQKGNVVYHGLAGHFFVQGVDHALKIRILADINDRVRWKMEREGLPEQEARRSLEKDDDQRRKWSRFLYGIDSWDSTNYDAIFHLRRNAVDYAVDFIYHNAKLPLYQTTPESQQRINDLTLAAVVKAALIKSNPNITVGAENGVIFVQTASDITQEEKVARKLKEKAEQVPDVKEARIKIDPTNIG